RGSAAAAFAHLPACPLACDEALGTPVALLAISSSGGPVTQAPIARESVAAAVMPPTAIALALDCRGIEDPAVRISGKVERQGDGRIGAEDEFGKALLAKAVVQPPLEAAKFALRHTVRRPGGIRFLRTLARGELGQVLQSYAFALVGMTGDAAEIVRPAPEVEDLLADPIHLDFLRVSQTHIHGDTSRSSRHERDQRLDVRFAIVARPEWLLF